MSSTDYRTSSRPRATDVSGPSGLSHMISVAAFLLSVGFAAALIIGLVP